MNFPVEALVTLFLAIGGGAFTAFKLLMSELKNQTATLAVISHRSNETDVWKDDFNKRLFALEAWRNKQSGIIEQEEKSNGGRIPPNVK